VTSLALDLKLLPLLIPFAYLLGSIPFGLLIVRARGGDDIRKAGSGNIGAANVARNAGIVAGLLTLILDAAKGYLAVWFALKASNGNLRWAMAAAVAVVFGHIFPVWLNFRGGKGVATGLGVFLLISWEAVAAAAALWILMVIFWRYSSLGSIVATAALPLLLYFLYSPGRAPSDYVEVCTLFISLLILWKHKANVERLIAGSEAKLGKRK
jgi:glycerol-3-phosphate acyltransferase PlsY